MVSMHRSSSRFHQILIQNFPKCFLPQNVFCHKMKKSPPCKNAPSWIPPFLIQLNCFSTQKGFFWKMMLLCFPFLHFPINKDYLPQCRIHIPLEKHNSLKVFHAKLNSAWFDEDPRKKIFLDVTLICLLWRVFLLIFNFSIKLYQQSWEWLHIQNILCLMAPSKITPLLFQNVSFSHLSAPICFGRQI